MKMKNATKHQYLQLLPVLGLYSGLLLTVFFALMSTKKMSYFIITPFPSPFFFAVLFFAFGIIYYNKNFNYFLQNGVSRQTYHWSFLMTLPIVIIAAVIDAFIYDYQCVVNDNLKLSVIALLKITMLMSCAYIFVFALGRLIASISIKFSFFGKIMILGFLPATLIIIINALIKNADAKKVELVFSFIKMILFGENAYNEINIWNLSVAFFVGAIIVISLCHLTVRKTEIKET
ncbi:MAG: hypothetical protein RRZ68_02055 [Oscillospiraceae bacterium]